jgi:hypothetical protein
MIAAGEDDAADEDAYDSAAFMITDTPETTRDRGSSMVRFSTIEVLLDNQAGRSIFKNRFLLSNVSNVTPFYIGIDGGSRGLRIDQEGNFGDFSRS